MENHLQAKEKKYIELKASFTEKENVLKQKVI